MIEFVQKKFIEFNEAININICVGKLSIFKSMIMQWSFVQVAPVHDEGSANKLCKQQNC